MAPATGLASEAAMSPAVARVTAATATPSVADSPICDTVNGDDLLSGRTTVAWPHRLPAAVFGIGIAVCITLALIPLVHMMEFIATTGANNPSNDYLVYTQLIDRILSGTYDWSHYFADTFIRSHSLAIPFLVRLAIIEWTHWNVYDELYISILLGTVKVVLFFDAFTRRMRSPFRWLLLPALSALCFSTSQITDYGYGDAGLPIGFNQLGLALGVWALVRFDGRWRGILVAALAGAMGTLSGGGGLPIWPALICGLALLNVRNPWKYSTVMAIALLTAIPYLIFPNGHSSVGSSIALWNWDFWLAAIAYPLGTSIPGTQLGLLGLTLSLAGIVLALLRGQPASVAAPLMVLVYGTVNIWLISVSRGVGAAGIAPWYAMHFVPYWLGLLSLAYALWANSPLIPWKNLPKVLNHVPRLWALSACVLVVIALLQTSPGLADQPFYLFSRAPVSASCLRSYQTAPTYCEAALFQWGPGRPGFVGILAEPLQRFHLSALGPDEQWPLQGDWILNSVRPHNASGAPLAHWERGDTRTSYVDFHHLDLILPHPDSVSWTVTLPHHLHNAVFHSAVRARRGPISARIEVFLDRGTTPIRGAVGRTVPASNSWQSVAIPLTRFAGHTLTISLGSSESATRPYPTLAYQYPTIDVHLLANTFVPPAPRMLQLTRRDYHFDLSKAGPHDLYSITKYGESLDRCAADYDFVYIRMATEMSPQGGYLDIYYSADHPPESPQPPYVQVPLFTDGQVHDYTFDLKLLDLPVGAQLTWMRFNPIYAATPLALAEGRSVRITDVRLVRRPGPTSCRS